MTPFLLLAPLVTVNGQPLMLLNVLDRRFVLLGVFFRPQDFHLVAIIALTALVTMVLVTVVFGRIWCGWLCPQTIFMEMVLRRIEYWIDGSAEQQLRRDRLVGAVDLEPRPEPAGHGERERRVPQVVTTEIRRPYGNLTIADQIPKLLFGKAALFSRLCGKFCRRK